ncbi:dual specificity protein kinase TTK [Anabrus simplex]|uniref:dual specificity protein kinase TTK n=1 Tax=Anabrus simplex TaxID=316456 RepID=UPI0035A2CFFF
MYKLAEVIQESDHESDDEFTDVSSFSYPGNRPRRPIFSVYRRSWNSSEHEVPSLPPRILPSPSVQQEVELATPACSEDSQKDINYVEKDSDNNVLSSSSSCGGITANTSVFQKVPQLSEDVETLSSSTCFKNKKNAQEGIEGDLTIGKLTYPPCSSKNRSDHDTRPAKLIQHLHIHSVDESALPFSVSKPRNQEIPAESEDAVQLAHSEIPNRDIYQEGKFVIKITRHMVSPIAEEEERHSQFVNKLHPASLEIADNSRDANIVLSSKVQENISQTPSNKQGVTNSSVTPCEGQENISVFSTPVSQSVKKGSNEPRVRTVLMTRTHSQYCNQPVPSLISLNTPNMQEEFGKKPLQEIQSASKSKKPMSQNVIIHSSKKLTPNHKICSRVQPVDNACVSEKKPKVICKNKENYSTSQFLEKPTNKVSTGKDQIDSRVPSKDKSSEVKRVPSKDLKIPAKKTLFNEAEVKEAHGSLSTKGLKEKVFVRTAPKQERDAGSHTSPLEPRTNFALTVKNKEYFVLSRLGFGGSSQVYQVLEPKTHNLLAIKCVNLADTDPATAQGYLNEIELLSKLQKSNRVIKLFDNEYVQQQQTLYVVMEKGDTDFSTLLKMMWSSKEGISMPMIIYYWTEMLSAVKDIHDYGVVHSDLKPANFLLVAGRLKLIDFGIASSVQNDMTSINKNGMAGTYNYMSPEAFHDPSDSNKTHKVGYKSDVWSLGCILYNMLYGKTPFHHLPYPAKMFMIINPDHKINYPRIEKCPPVLMEAMKSCLTFNYKLRPTVTELLNLPYICYDSPVKNGKEISG